MAWTEEATSITQTNPTFKQMDLTNYELAGYTTVGNTLSQDAPGLEAFLFQLFSAAVGAARLPRGRRIAGPAPENLLRGRCSMAWLERRGNRYRIKFRHAGKTCQVALRTGKDREADSCLVRFEENYRLYERGRLELPSGADLGLFLVSDGKLAVRPVAARVATLEELLTHYETNHPAGAKEATTTYTERIHFKHLRRHLGNRTPVTAVTTHALQTYVETRSSEKTRCGQPVILDGRSVNGQVLLDDKGHVTNHPYEDPYQPYVGKTYADLHLT